MNLREEIQERIAKLDEAVLPDVMRELNFIEERRNREFSQKFLDTVQAIKERNKDVDPDELLRDITEAVNADRQKRR